MHLQKLTMMVSEHIKSVFFCAYIPSAQLTKYFVHKRTVTLASITHINNQINVSYMHEAYFIEN